MSGHSKWANIKHKKAKEDASRGKAFTKLIKEITIAAKEGGDVNFNPRLRTLVEKAKDINMPLDNIKRAIAKGSGESSGQGYERHMYEGYGPGGIAVMIEVLTDSKNRAIAELRHSFSRNGGNIADHGAVSWMFKEKGIIRIAQTKLSEDELLENLMNFEVDDISKHEDTTTITCEVSSLDLVKKELKDLGCKIEHAEIEWVAKTSFEVAEEDQERAYEFLDAIENLDDVQNVYTNLQ